MDDYVSIDSSISHRTDEIIPLTAFDHIPVFSQIVVTYAFIFDGKLDHVRLKEALFELATKKYRVLGARLRKNKDGKLEYRIPGAFVDDSPPCTFSHSIFDGPVENWVQLPKRQSASISVSDDELIDYEFFGFEKGRKIGHYLKDPPIPVFSAHCSIFADKTLIGVTTPHVFNDAKGMEEIMHAWASVVNDGINSVQELSPIYDPWPVLEKTSTPGMNGATRLATGWKKWSMWQFLIFVGWLVWEKIWQPKESSRIFHFPKSKLDELRAACERELEKQVSLSINDVLVAWLAKKAFSSYSASNRTSVTLTVTADIRKRLHSISLFAEPYISNASLSVLVCPLTTGDLHTLSVAQIAAKVRNAVATQLREEYATKLVVEGIQSVRRDEMLMSYPHDGLPFLSTNWSHCRFEDVSFKGAVVDDRGSPCAPDWKVDSDSGVERSRTGKLDLTLAAISSVFSSRRSAAILHREEDGSLWVKMTLSDRAWEKLRLKDGLILLDGLLSPE